MRYDGTDFAGWQVQPAQRTIQGVIEDVLAKIAGNPIKIAGAGRTDAGVHALGQVFHFTWPEGEPPERLLRALNGMLDGDVRIESLEAAPPEFHSSFSSTGKRYAYVIAEGKFADPLLARYAWTPGYDIDWDLFERTAQRIVGEHDFAGFCCAGSGAETTNRIIHSVTIDDGPLVGPADTQGVRRIEFHGNGFLYKMIRNLVGTLTDIARGHHAESTLEQRLAAPAPYQGYTAPAKGLFMVKIEY